MVTKIFGLLLLLSPIVVGANINMDVFDLIFFRTGIIVLFMASLMDKPLRVMPKWVNTSVLYLLALCVANIFISSFAAPVMAQTMNLFLFIAGFYIVHTHLEDTKKIIPFMLWAGGINLCFLFFQKIGFDPIFDKIPDNCMSTVGAFLGNNPRLADYLALLLPFTGAWFLILGVILIAITKQSIIGIPVLLMLLFRTQQANRRIVYLILSFLCILAFRNHIGNSMFYRFEAWIPALEAFFDRPLIGFGLGVRVVPNMDALFSSYLSFIVGIGIMGAVWIGYVFKTLYKKIGRNTESVALITLAMLMLVEYPIEITRLWYLIMAIMVMAVLKFSSANKEEAWERL